MSAFRTFPQALETARVKGTRLVDTHRSRPVRPSHRPPPAKGRRFRVAGADVSASLAVFLIALPLSLGIALATGAPLQAGLVAAAVGGLVAGRLGGSALQVSGPAAGLTVVTAELIHRYGWRTTCAITVLAGLAQLGLGCLRVARSALAVSPAIVHGMLAGIGVTIAVAQLHIVLGGTPQSAVLDNLAALPAQLAHLHPAAVSMSALTLALLLLWPRLPGPTGRLLRRIPAPLIAVAGATATASLAGIALPKVELPSWHSHALAGLPEGPALGIATAVLTTTLVCSVQSLLGAVAVDKLAAARPGLTAKVGRSNLDRELLGQGAANIASGALGGLPVAGVAVRSTANVNAGAVSRNSTMLHGVLVVVAALLMVPMLELIPLASLAALVMAVGIQMVSLNHIRTVTRHREVLVYAVTTLGVVLLGVLEGVTLGIAVAVAVALNRLTRTRITHDDTPEGVHHIHVRGQLTFLAVPRLSRALHHVPHGAHVVVELDGSFMDHAAFETLQDWRNTHTAQGGTVELAGRRGGTRFTEPTVTPRLDLDQPSFTTTPSGAECAECGEVGGSGGASGGGGASGAGVGGTGGVTGAGGIAGAAEFAGAGGVAGAGAVSGAATGAKAAIGAGRGGVAGAVGAGGLAGVAVANGSLGANGGARAEGSTGVNGSTGITRTTAATGAISPTSPVDAPIADCRCRPWTPWRNHQCEPSDSPKALEALAALEALEPSMPDALPGHPAPRHPAPEPALPDVTAPHHTPPDPTAPDSTTAHTTAPHLTTRDLTPPPPTNSTPTAPLHGLGGTGARTGATAAGPHGTGPGTNADPGPSPSPGTDKGTGTSKGPGTGTGTGTKPGTGTGTGTGTRAVNARAASGHQLARGISAFQRNTAPLVRSELARLAREGQRPSQLFLTCTDSRVVTSMITSSGPGDLFVVRNMGNLVPLPGAESGDDSVAAAIEYGVDVLKVRSITVCGHSGCSAMQALSHTEPGGARTPFRRWLRHGLPSLERMADTDRPGPTLAGRRPVDSIEQLSLTNVVQQLEHLRAHEAVAQALREGALELHGMYFHVGEAQAYLLTEQGEDRVFDDVRGAEELPSRA